MVNVMVTMLHKEHRRFPLSYPKLADEEASILQAHVALLLDDLLDSLENITGHCNIPAHVDVSSLLPQALVHHLWQLLTQYILHIFLTERQRRYDEYAWRSYVWKQCEKQWKESGDHWQMGNKEKWSRICQLEAERLLVCPNEILFVFLNTIFCIFRSFHIQLLNIFAKGNSKQKRNIHYSKESRRKKEDLEASIRQMIKILPEQTHTAVQRG